MRSVDAFRAADAAFLLVGADDYDAAIGAAFRVLLAAGLKKGTAARWMSSRVDPRLSSAAFRSIHGRCACDDCVEWHWEECQRSRVTPALP